MLKESAALVGLFMVFTGGLLHGQHLSGQPATFQGMVRPQDRSGTPSPSSPELRSKSKIVLVRHGCYGTCPRYTVTLYGNGKIVYEGEEFVRVKGNAKKRISGKAVDDLLRKISEMEFFTFHPQLAERCIEDGPSASITLRELGGRQRTVDDKCLLGNAMGEIESAIDSAVHIQQWIFIDAKELQRQIDRGWDITKHGREYARDAVEWDDPEVLRVLVRNGVSVETVGYDGESLLQRAVTANRYASVKALLELDVNPRAFNSDGWGPAQNAGNRSIEMCKLFLEHGVGINEQDGMGETMLMNAAGSPGNFKIVKFLVSSGANLNLRDQAGETAIGKAQRMRQQFRGSIDFTFNPNYPRFFDDPEIARASCRAAQRQYEDVIEYLRQHGGTE